MTAEEQEQHSEAQLHAAAQVDDQSSIAALLAKVDPEGNRIVDEPAPPVQTPPSEPPQPEGEPAPEAAAERTGDEPPVAETIPQIPEEIPSEGEEWTPEDDHEKEIAALQAPKGASSKTESILKILKRLNVQEHRSKKEFEAKLREAEARKILDEDTEKELNELRRRADIRAVEASPRFNQQYVAPIQRHEANAMGVMRQFNLPEDTAKLIQSTGGLFAFKNSDLRMPVGTKDLEGKPFAGSRAEWFEQVLDPIIKDLPTAAKSRINYHINEGEKAMFAWQEAIAAARANPRQIIEQDKAAFEESFKAYSEQADAQLAKEADLYGEIAKPKEIPPSATKDQIADIKAHNARLTAAQDTIRKVFTDVGRGDPKVTASAAAALAYRDFAQQRMKEMDAELKAEKAAHQALKDKWEKAKGVAQTSRQQSTVHPVTPKTVEHRGWTTDDDTKGIRELMEAEEQGTLTPRR